MGEEPLRRRAVKPQSQNPDTSSPHSQPQFETQLLTYLAYTLHFNLQTLSPKLRPLNPQPPTQNPKAPNPKPDILTPKPYTLNPEL